MGKLHTLAAGTALLALGVKAQFTYMGCAALDTSNVINTTDLFPQSPARCLAYCNSIGIGYTYAGINAQFCSCWPSSPVVTKAYANSQNVDCSFNCDAPYNNQYCGGIDLSTLGFLYSYYAGVAPAIDNPPAGPAAPSSTAPGEVATPSGGVISPSATSSAGDGGATPPSSTDAGGVSPQSSSSFDGGLPTLPSTSAGEVLPPTSSGASGVLPPVSSAPSGGAGPSGSDAPGSGGTPPQSSLPSGAVVPTPSGSGPAGSGTASPSATGVGGAPVVTLVALSPGQPFVINIAPYLRTVGDQALSYIPLLPWFLYNANITSFTGTVPLDFPLGPLTITVTAGQRTTGSNGPVGRRQVQAGTYTFAIQLIIVAPVVPVPPLPTSSRTSVPSGPVVPGATTTPGAVLPSYTNTVYQTITSTITRCPVCKPEVTQFRVPIGTTCITAEVFTTPCPVTVKTKGADGKVVPTVITTASQIPYNPAESTVVVTTYSDLTTKYTTTLLVAVTQTVQKLAPTGAAAPVQAPPAAPPAGPPAAPAGPVPAGPAGPVPAGPVPAAPAPPNGAPFAGPVAQPPNAAVGTGAANNGSKPAPTMPVTAGATMDRFVEMFVLLSGVAVGALLLL